MPLSTIFQLYRGGVCQEYMVSYIHLCITFFSVSGVSAEWKWLHLYPNNLKITKFNFNYKF